MTIQRHKISLSVNYVNTWTIQDALREIFQNAIDSALDGGQWLWEYKNETLKVISKDASLSKKFLLLGMSEKKEGSLGRHGEGLKLSCLVLCRLGYKPYILTGTESWEPKLIKSRTYKTQQLVFDVHSDQPQVDDIVFVVPGITSEVFSELQDKNLHVRRPSLGWHTSRGHILPEDYAGKIYVGGLYVCEIALKHGYNFEPFALKLDRDRRMVSDFDVNWQTCQMWKETDEFDYILWLIKENAPDVKYLDSFTYSAKEGLADKAAEAFLDEHGQDAIPVVDNYDMGKAKEEGHENIVIVPKVTVQLLEQSKIWSRPAPKVVKKTPREELQDFWIEHSDNFTELMKLQYSVLIEHAKDWSN